MHALLSALRRGDERGVAMSSDVLAVDLGWDVADIAEMLREARAGMLVWGRQTGGTPRPQYEDIELTVQGSRFLRHNLAGD